MILLYTDDDAVAAHFRDATSDLADVDVTRTASGIQAARSPVGVVVIDGSHAADRAFELAGRFDDNRPDLAIVVLAAPSGDTFALAMQHGVRELVAPDAPHDELRAAVKRAIEVAERRQQTIRTIDDRTDHRLILVVSPKGGAGKTTVASNLAVGLATRAPKQVVLVDGDLQFGDVGNALRLLPESNVRDAIAGGLQDGTEVKVHLTPHRTGLFALCAPDSPGVADEITPQAFTRASVLLSGDFKYVVVDTDPGLGERTLMLMDNASDLVFVAATDVASVRGLHKTLEALDRIGIVGPRRHLVLNRSDAKVGLEVDDIASTIGMQPDVLLPSHRSVPISMNQGVPILEQPDMSPVSDALWSLVDRFEPDPDAATAEKGRGGLFGRRS